MNKCELALQFFPEQRNAKQAVRHLMRWIQRNPSLLCALQATGYQSTQKVFTWKQVLLIKEHLGDP